MAEVGDGAGPEGALGALEVELVGAERVEDEADVLQVLGPRKAIDQDILKEDKHEPPKERLQDVVHECLEHSRRVGETKRHDEELEVAVVGAECRLLRVGQVHAHLVIAGMQVQLGEEHGAMQLIEELVDQRDQELVLGGLVIERAVVDAEAPGAVCLLDQQHGPRMGRC